MKRIVTNKTIKCIEAIKAGAGKTSVNIVIRFWSMVIRVFIWPTTTRHVFYYEICQFVHSPGAPRA
jgi:hypothetical protein